MKLLLCVSSRKDIEMFLEKHAVNMQPDSVMPYMHHCKLFHHETDIIETGAGVYQTAYKLTKALSKQKYHLALKFSLGNAYKEDISAGTVLNIVNEKPGDYGMMAEGEWKDHYDSGLIKREEAPHVRGGLINLTNAYMNVFLPFRKAVGATVNHYADKNSFKQKREKYMADAETGDGLGFVYPCLYEKQLFYHLCVVERNLETGENNPHAALLVMNETLTGLLEKL